MTMEANDKIAEALELANKVGDHTSALRVLQHHVATASSSQSNNAVESSVRACNSIALALIKGMYGTRDLNAADTYLKWCLSVPLVSPALRACTLNNRAIYWSQSGRNEEALRCLQRSETIQSKAMSDSKWASGDDDDVSLHITLNWTTVLTNLGRHEEALDKAKRGMGMAIAIARAAPANIELLEAAKHNYTVAREAVEGLGRRFNRLDAAPRSHTAAPHHSNGASRGSRTQASEIGQQGASGISARSAALRGSNSRPVSNSSQESSNVPSQGKLPAARAGSAPNVRVTRPSLAARTLPYEKVDEHMMFEPPWYEMRMKGRAAGSARNLLHAARLDAIMPTGAPGKPAATRTMRRAARLYSSQHGCEPTAAKEATGVGRVAAGKAKSGACGRFESTDATGNKSSQKLSAARPLAPLPDMDRTASAHPPAPAPSPIAPLTLLPAIAPLGYRGLADQARVEEIAVEGEDGVQLLAAAALDHPSRPHDGRPPEYGGQQPAPITAWLMTEHDRLGAVGQANECLTEGEVEQPVQAISLPAVVAIASVSAVAEDVSAVSVVADDDTVTDEARPRATAAVLASACDTTLAAAPVAAVAPPVAVRPTPSAAAAIDGNGFVMGAAWGTADETDPGRAAHLALRTSQQGDRDAFVPVADVAASALATAADNNAAVAAEAQAVPMRVTEEESCSASVAQAASVAAAEVKAPDAAKMSQGNSAASGAYMASGEGDALSESSADAASAAAIDASFEVSTTVALAVRATRPARAIPAPPVAFTVITPAVAGI